MEDGEMQKETWNCKKYVFWIYLFLTALLPLLLCSKCSPLYPLNDWPDANIFFTVGKGMAHGKVMYVDLIDHKGPYVYAVYALAYLISRDSFIGIFFLEVVNMFFFLLYSWKTVCLYTENENTGLWCLPLLAAGMTAAKSFVHGGSIEELCVGIFAYAVYSMLCFLRREREMKAGILLVNGILAGILFWSKFTLLGLYIAWIVLVFTVHLARRQIRKAFQSASVFMGAFLATTIPWLVYFGIYHKTNVWLQTYLWNNIFGYTSSGSSGIGERLATALLNAFRSVKDPENLSYGILVMAGCTAFCVCFWKGVSLIEKMAVGLMGFLTALGIFVGGTKHDYYGLPLAVFGMFGIVSLALAEKHIAKKLREHQVKAFGAIRSALAVGTLIIGLFMDYKLSPNVYLLQIKQEDMPQYRFAEIVNHSEDKTILNYGFLDGGFYTVLDQVPVVPYFCVMNIHPDVILAEQNRYLEQGLTNWVVTWKAYTAQEEELKSLPVLSEYYDLVEYVYFPFEGAYRTYALYERKK